MLRLFLLSLFFSVCLPSKPIEDPDKYLNWATVLIGWGSQYKSGNPSEVLNKAQLSIFEAT